LAAGAQVRPGTLDDLDVLRNAAAASDGVIHLAFKHDLVYAGAFPSAADANSRAVETFAEALAGSNRPLIVASVTPKLAQGRVATELDGHDSASSAGLGHGLQTRFAMAEFTLSLAFRGIRSCIVRLPPTNHGDGDNGFMAALVGMARDKDVSGYIGDGASRWAAVHRLDSAHLFCLALEKAPAGATLHAVADEGVPPPVIAEVIGRHLGVPVTAISPEAAGEHFGWLAGPLATDGVASSALTREQLGWQSTQPGLIDDLEQGHYFKQR